MAKRTLDTNRSHTVDKQLDQLATQYYTGKKAVIVHPSFNSHRETSGSFHYARKKNVFHSPMEENLNPSFHSISLYRSNYLNIGSSFKPLSKMVGDYLTHLEHLNSNIGNYLDFISPEADVLYSIGSFVPGPIKEEATSDLTVTREGFIEEKWQDIENLPSRLLEVTATEVTLECMTDISTKEIENRRFPRSLLEGIIPFKPEYPVMVKIFSRAGEVRFKFLDGSNLFNLDLFKKEYYKGLSNEKLTKRSL